MVMNRTRFTRSAFKSRGFTLIEILIVISIIGILAATIIPNFIGFDAEARMTATKSNLESIRTRINLFRAKEGRYPETLEELTTVRYNDLGIQKPYLKKIPFEMISNPKGNNAVRNQTYSERLNGQGGWVYETDRADVKVNVNEPLGHKWGEFEDEIPSEW